MIGFMRRNFKFLFTKNKINISKSKLNKINYGNYSVDNKNTNAGQTDVTIFDKIISKEIKSDIVYEDEDVIAFNDINPAAPIHILIIPKKKNGLNGISKGEECHVEVLGRLMLTAKKLGEKFGLKDGYRLVVNEGKHGCQSVFHFHIHFLAGKQFGWPPGTDIDFNTKILI